MLGNGNSIDLRPITAMKAYFHTTGDIIGFEVKQDDGVTRTFGRTSPLETDSNSGWKPTGGPIAGINFKLSSTNNELHSLTVRVVPDPCTPNDAPFPMVMQSYTTFTHVMFRTGTLEAYTNLCINDHRMKFDGGNFPANFPVGEATDSDWTLKFSPTVPGTFKFKVKHLNIRD